MILYVSGDLEDDTNRATTGESAITNSEVHVCISRWPERGTLGKSRKEDDWLKHCWSQVHEGEGQHLGQPLTVSYIHI